jgi:DNA repair protein RecO (recombination protein O)
VIANTQSIVLRAVKYGETSIISTQFTRLFGVQAYLVRGVRTSSAKGRSNKAGLLQPCTLLDITSYQKPQSNLHRLNEFSVTKVFSNLYEEIMRNSIAIFSAELLLRLLPEAAPMPEFFDFAQAYFLSLDEIAVENVGNFPLFFALQASRAFGYELSGTWTEETPYLDIRKGSFSEGSPLGSTAVTLEDAKALAALMHVQTFKELHTVKMNAGMRFRLLEWFLEFLRCHTEHMGQLKSLQVLKAVLH